jgi:hypothetical protein
VMTVSGFSMQTRNCKQKVQVTASEPGQAAFGPVGRA